MLVHVPNWKQQSKRNCPQKLIEQEHEKEREKDFAEETGGRGEEKLCQNRKKPKQGGGWNEELDDSDGDSSEGHNGIDADESSDVDDDSVMIEVIMRILKIMIVIMMVMITMIITASAEKEKAQRKRKGTDYD